MAITNDVPLRNPTKKRLPLLTMAAALMIAVLLPGRAMSAFDPREIYGDGIQFDVYREGKLVGRHDVSFSRSEDSLVVESRFEIAINFLFFTAYKYVYQSSAWWQDGDLSVLKAEVNDNGDVSSLITERAGDRMVLNRSGERDVVAAPLLPTNHWNSAVLVETRVLNTLTGRVNNVRIVPREREQIPTERGPVAATRYLYTGDLATEVWYDDAGRWVKMRFQGTDGSTIDYRCRRCQGPAPERAQG
jgi:hypothetical protein